MDVCVYSCGQQMLWTVGVTEARNIVLMGMGGVVGVLADSSLLMHHLLHAILLLSHIIHIYLIFT